MWILFPTGLKGSDVSSQDLSSLNTTLSAEEMSKTSSLKLLSLDWDWPSKKTIKAKLWFPRINLKLLEKLLDWGSLRYIPSPWAKQTAERQGIVRHKRRNCYAPSLDQSTVGRGHQVQLYLFGLKSRQRQRRVRSKVPVHYTSSQPVISKSCVDVRIRSFRMKRYFLSRGWR